MPLPRFQRLGQDKRTQLLDIAAKEFADKGFDAASLNDILARAGFGKSSYYYYFEDKEDLYITCVLDAVGRLVPEGGGLPLETLDAGNYWKATKEWAMGLVVASASHPVTMALFREAPAIRRMLGPRARAVAEEMAIPVVAAIRRGQALGCVRTDLDADQLWALGMAIDETLDEELMVRADPVTADDLRRHARLGFDIWKRLLIRASPDTWSGPAA
jgi:AcrR family transcriptional regulator